MEPSMDHLLCSNITPDADERLQAESAVHKKWLEISELDGVIQNLHSALWTLQSRREALVSELFQLQTALAPIRRLPPELLVEIFLYFQPCIPRSSDDRWHRASPPWRLGLVCRSWRDIAVGLSQLWSALDFPGNRKRRPSVLHLPTHEYDDVELQTVSQQDALEEAEGFEIEGALETVNACLVRSKNQGLAIRLRRRDSTLEMLILELLFQHTHRWEEIVLIDPSEAVCRRLRGLPQRLPRLRRLEYSATGYHSDWHVDHWPSLDRLFQSSHAPCLTELTLVGVDISSELPSVPWARLNKFCELHCGFMPAQRLAVFRQLTNLVVLRIDSSESSITVWGTRAVFPNLRVASFRFQPRPPTWNNDVGDGDVLGPIAFEMPVLQEFNVQGDIMRKFSECIPRESPLLQRLSVHFRQVGFCPGDTEEVFSLFPA
ncbi:hypothetical protein C8F01DRAFT_305952 [Mycena amicta]|nr:hypothetical protein C8F01DRAFT_305952 [Mycena amicta]